MLEITWPDQSPPTWPALGCSSGCSSTWCHDGGNCAHDNTPSPVRLLSNSLTFKLMRSDQIVYLHDLPHDGGVEALGELDQPRIEKTLQSCWEWEACRRRQVVNLPWDRVPWSRKRDRRSPCLSWKFFLWETNLWIIYQFRNRSVKAQNWIWNPHLKSIASCLSVTISLNWGEFESKLYEWCIAWKRASETSCP